MAGGHQNGLTNSIWASAPSYTRSQSNSTYSRRSTSLPRQSQSQPQPYAPRPAPAPPPTASRIPRPQALHRFEQVCQRIRWKYIDLQRSYDRALRPEEAGFSAVDAERNFKVDFYEFYTWIEQAVLLLLRIFKVDVRSGEGGNGNGNHTYHHDVLRALEDHGGELTGVLGTGEVMAALWKAKELRNRWKDEDGGWKGVVPLRLYNLEWLVGTILGGLEVAYGVARGRVEEEQDAGNGNGEREGEGEEGWEWMVEPMDWEA